jgi:hypothetical protein
VVPRRAVAGARSEQVDMVICEHEDARRHRSSTG